MIIVQMVLVFASHTLIFPQLVKLLSFMGYLVILFLFHSLTVVIQTQDCVLTAIVSVYQCQNRCKTLYGSTQPSQRMFYNSSSQLCEPKAICPTGWTYVSKSNTCINDLGKNNTVINGWILSSNIQNLTVVYASCNNNGYFFNGTCICNPGWASSQTQVYIDKNVTTMQFCDQIITPGNLKSGPGETMFNGYSWSEKRQSLDEIFPQGEQWINPLVIISIPIYCTILLFSMHHCILKMIKRNRSQKENNVINTM